MLEISLTCATGTLAVPAVEAMVVVETSFQNGADVSNFIGVGLGLNDGVKIGTHMDLCKPLSVKKC